MVTEIPLVSPKEILAFINKSKIDADETLLSRIRKGICFKIRKS